MLLILIPIAWLAVVTVVVAVCQASALGEGAATCGEEAAYDVREGWSCGNCNADADAAIALGYDRTPARGAPAPQVPSRAQSTPGRARPPLHSAR